MQPYTLKNDPYSSHSFIAKSVVRHNPRRILDIGCGPGLVARALGPEWKGRLWALDMDPEAIQRAKKYYCAAWIMDIEKQIPKKRKKFDCLVFGDILEHLVDPWRTLKMCADQLLKCGGIIIISLPNAVNWYVRTQLAMGNFNYQKRGLMDRTHLRFFTWKSAQKLVGGADLKIIDYRVSPIPLPLIWKQTDIGQKFYWLHKLNNRITNFRPGLFGYQLMFVCRKEKK